MKSWEQIVLDKLNANLPQPEPKQEPNLELNKLTEINENLKNLKVKENNEPTKD